MHLDCSAGSVSSAMRLSSNWAGQRTRKNDNKLHNACITWHNTHVRLLNHQLEVGICLGNTARHQLQVVGSSAACSAPAPFLRVATGDVESALAVPQTRPVRVASNGVLQAAHPLLPLLVVSRLQAFGKLASLVGSFACVWVLEKVLSLHQGNKVKQKVEREDQTVVSGSMPGYPFPVRGRKLLASKADRPSCLLYIFWDENANCKKKRAALLIYIVFAYVYH